MNYGVFSQVKKNHSSECSRNIRRSLVALFPDTCPPFVGALLGIGACSVSDLRQKGSGIKLVNGAEGWGWSRTEIVGFGVCVEGGA